jgi:hypothetical protein
VIGLTFPVPAIASIRSDRQHVIEFPAWRAELSRPLAWCRPAEGLHHERAGRREKRVRKNLATPTPSSCSAELTAGP